MSIKLDYPYESQSIEGRNALTLDFSKLTSNNQNVIPVAVQNAITNEVILIAYTNEFAFKETIKQRKAIFWKVSNHAEQIPKNSKCKTCYNKS
jgi:phosphoribosyl-AMP cyclohydrolase